jgi:hypothetical protein
VQVLGDTFAVLQKGGRLYKIAGKTSLSIVAEQNALPMLPFFSNVAIFQNHFLEEKNIWP